MSLITCAGQCCSVPPLTGSLTALLLLPCGFLLLSVAEVVWGCHMYQQRLSANNPVGNADK